MEQEPKLFSKRNIISIFILLLLSTGIVGGLAIRDNVTQFFSRANEKTGQIENVQPNPAVRSDGRWQNVSITYSTSGVSDIKLYWLNTGTCIKDSTCTGDGWNQLKFDLPPSGTVFWEDNGSLQVVSPGRDVTIGLFGDGVLLSAVNMGFPPDATSPPTTGTSGTGAPATGQPSGAITSFSVNPVTRSGSNWSNVTISYNYANASNVHLYWLNQGTCSKSSCGFGGWNRIQTLSSASGSIVWDPSEADIQPGRVTTIGLISDSPGAVLDVKDIAFEGTSIGTGTNTVSVSPASITKTNGNWPTITINTNVENQGGAHLYIKNQNCPGCNENQGWTPFGVDTGSNTVFSGRETYEYLLPSAGARAHGAGTYMFSLYTPDGNTRLATSNTLILVEATGTGSTNNASSCERVTIKQGANVVYEKIGTANPTNTAPVSTNQTYQVEIVMKNQHVGANYTPATWAKGNVGESSKYFLGFPTEGDSNTTPGASFKVNRATSDLSANTQWSINWPDPTKLRLPLTRDSIPAGDQNTFSFNITPQRGGNHSFYWSMVQENVEWFGAQCAIDIDVDSAGVNPNAPAVGGTQCAVVSSATIPEDVKCDSNFPAVDGGPRVVQYTSHPLQNVEFGFGASATTGVKTVHVRFISTSGQVSQEYTKSILYQAAANISNASCTYSPDGTGTIVTIDGVGFGGSQGQSKIHASGKLIEGSPITWTDTKVQIKSRDRLTGSVPIKFTGADNRTSEKNCQVNISSVDFTARIQCRAADKAEGDELDIKIYEVGTSTSESQPQHRSKSKLDRTGKPQNLQVSFEESKGYVMVIKAPGALAKKIPLQPGSSRVVTVPIVLSAGDIGGNNTDIQDGQVNQFDRTLMASQWSIGSDVSRQADLNRDKRVNAIDYSCMLSNWSKNDEKFDPAVDAAGVVSTPRPSGQ